MRPLAMLSVAMMILGLPSHAATIMPIAALPESDVFSLSAKGDTIAAGTDTCVFVSTDAGTTWHASAAVTPGRPIILAVRVHNGSIYAGTARQGVFVSTNLGTTWSAFNQGLVGGILDSQLDIADFAVRDDSLFVATLGAGVYVRPLEPGGTWHPFGDAFEPNEASDVWGLALGGTRLVAAAGDNGEVLDRDPGDPDWSVSSLNNVGLAPGVEAKSVIWNGNAWVVSTNVGLFRSATGEEPWTRTDPGFGPIHACPFAIVGHGLIAAFDLTSHTVMATSSDDGATWNTFDDTPSVFVYALAVSRGGLFAARADGLYRVTEIASVSGEPRAGVRFALAGAQPAGDRVRFRIESAAGGPASIDVFDVAGRRVAPPIRFTRPAGPLELSWDARALESGVYLARLTTASQEGIVRIVHVR